MEIQSFEDFLKRKKDEGKDASLDDRKDQWISSVNGFYKNVQKWLNPFVEQSLLKVNEKDVIIDEEFIGSYKMKQLDILLGTDVISLIPRGTLVLGSLGRIDMKGPKGDRLIIEPKWNDWKFVTKINKRELRDANEESFKSAIQDLVNG